MMSSTIPEQSAIPGSLKQYRNCRIPSITSSLNMDRRIGANQEAARSGSIVSKKPTGASIPVFRRNCAKIGVIPLLLPFIFQPSAGMIIMSTEHRTSNLETAKRKPRHFADHNHPDVKDSARSTCVTPISKSSRKTNRSE